MEAHRVGNERRTEMNTETKPISERLPEYLFSSIHQAIGAASMCWIPQPSEQVFDSNRAAEIALELCRDIADWHERLEARNEQ